MVAVLSPIHPSQRRPEMLSDDKLCEIIAECYFRDPETGRMEFNPLGAARAIEQAARAELLAGVGMEPVGYFQKERIWDGSYWEQVEDRYKSDADVVPLYTADQLAAAVAKAKAEQRIPPEFAEIMSAVFREIENDDEPGSANAPGHGHEVPGIWDDDNGELSGQPCAWCALWNKAKRMLADATPHSAGVVREGGAK